LAVNTIVTPTGVLDDLIPVADFAAEIGVQTETIRDWYARHGLPVLKIGRRLYLVRDEARAWVLSQRRQSRKVKI